MAILTLYGGLILQVGTVKEVYGAFETDLRRSLDQGERVTNSMSEATTEAFSPQGFMRGWEMRKKATPNAPSGAQHCGIIVTESVLLSDGR